MTHMIHPHISSTATIVGNLQFVGLYAELFEKKYSSPLTAG